MSKLTKSPLRVARQALAVATEALRPYAHKYSPKKFTQPQLLLRQPRARRVFRKTVRRFLQRRRKVKRAALDSTGLDCGHASRYYVRRRHGATKQWQTVAYSRYAKLEASFDCATHLMLAALV